MTQELPGTSDKSELNEGLYYERMPDLQEINISPPKSPKKPKEKPVDPKRIYWLKHLEKLKEERDKITN